MSVKTAAMNVIVKETVIVKPVVVKIAIVQLKNGLTTLLTAINCNDLDSCLDATNIWNACRSFCVR